MKKTKTSSIIKMSLSVDYEGNLLPIKSKDEGRFITSFAVKELNLENESELKNIFRNYVHSFNVWENGNCKNSTYIGMYGVAVDVDSGLSIEIARRRFSHLIYIIYTSTNHTKEKNKFRILFPFDLSEKDLYFTKAAEADLALEHVNSCMVPESDKSTYKRASKFFPSCGNEDMFELYVNYVPGKTLFLNITEDHLLSIEKELLKNKKLKYTESKVTVNSTTKAWKRPSALNTDDLFVLPDQSAKLT